MSQPRAGTTDNAVVPARFDWHDAGMSPGPAGILFVDKPVGPSSRDVLDDLERRLGFGALGHAGTLDPRASGLLVVLVGVARRLQDVFMATRKEYTFDLTLGARSETHDGEGPIVQSGTPVPGTDELDLEGLLGEFEGEIDQVPPAHSAVHVGGRRAYELARRGEAPSLPPRRVLIERIELLSRKAEVVSLRVTCGKGTYIRSLARDLGERIGCGGYVSALRRTASGEVRVEQATPAAELVREDIRDLTAALGGFVRVDVDADQARRLANGQALSALDPPQSLAFAWFDGRPLCRLKASSRGGARSDLLLERPES